MYTLKWENRLPYDIFKPIVVRNAENVLAEVQLIVVLNRLNSLGSHLDIYSVAVQTAERML